MARTIKTVFEVMSQTRGTSSINKVSQAFADLKKQASGAKGAMSTATSRMAATKKSAIGGAFQTMAIGGGFKRVGAGIGQFVKQTVEHAGALESELANLKGISGASADSMNRLSEAAKRAGIETQFTPTETVQSLAALAQQGFTTEQQLSSLNSVLMLSGASGGKVPLADSATVITQTLKAFGLEASKAGVTVDQLVKTTTLSGLGIDEISDAMQNASAGAISMNVSLESTLATLGLIKNIIPSASMAGSAFQVLTGRLSSGKTQKKLKQEIGLDVVDPKTGKFKEFGELIVNISEKLGKMKEGDRGKLIGEAFGERAKKGILSVMAQLQKGITTQSGKVLKGAKAWEHWKKQLDPKTVRGFAKAMNDLKLDTLNGQIELLSGSMQTFQIELGKGVASLTKGAIKAFLSVFNKVLEMFTALPKPVKTAISGFLAFSAVLLTVVGTIFIMKGAMALLGISFSSIMMSIGSILAIVIPLTVAFGALALVAFSFYRAFNKNIGGIGDSAASAMDKIKAAYQAVVDLVSKGALSEATNEQLEKIGSNGLNKFVNFAGVAIANLRSFFDGVVSGFDDNLSTLVEPFEKLKTALGKIFAPFLDKGGEAKTKTEAFGKAGSAVGITMAQLAVSLLKVVTWAAEAGPKFIKFTKSIKWEDVVNGAKGFLTVLSGIGTIIKWIGIAFKFVGTLIGEGLAWLFLFITEKIPGAVSSMVKAFSNAATQIKGFLEPIFRLIDKIPDKLLPPSLVKFKEERRNENVPGRVASVARQDIPGKRFGGEGLSLLEERFRLAMNNASEGASGPEKKELRLMDKQFRIATGTASGNISSLSSGDSKKLEESFLNAINIVEKIGKPVKSEKTVNASILLDKEVLGKAMMKWKEGEDEDDFSIDDMSPSGAAD